MSSDAKEEEKGFEDLVILHQYLKDLSFESSYDTASKSQEAVENPANISVDVRKIDDGDDLFEVVLGLNISLKNSVGVIYILEMKYAGIIKLPNAERNGGSALFVTCPHYLYPQARQLATIIIQNGGFVMNALQPIDFADLFEKKIAEEQDNNTQNIH